MTDTDAPMPSTSTSESTLDTMKPPYYFPSIGNTDARILFLYLRTETNEGGKFHRVYLIPNKQRGLPGQRKSPPACPLSQQGILIHQNMGHLIHQQFHLAGPIPRLRICLLYRNVFESSAWTKENQQENFLVGQALSGPSDNLAA